MVTFKVSKERNEVNDLKIKDEEHKTFIEKIVDMKELPSVLI